MITNNNNNCKNYSTNKSQMALVSMAICFRGVSMINNDAYNRLCNEKRNVERSQPKLMYVSGTSNWRTIDEWEKDNDWHDIKRYGTF